MTRVLAIILKLDKTSVSVYRRIQNPSYESYEDKLGRITLLEKISEINISIGEQQRQDRRFLAREIKFWNK